MSKLRMINTSFWSDPWVEELSPQEKLLYIYLFTNEKVNMLGVYEVSKKKISYETGLSLEMVSKGLEAFETIKKVFYKENYIIMVNFIKNQKLNNKMIKSAIDVFNNLPKSLNVNDLYFDKDNPSEAFETLSNPLKWFGNMNMNKKGNKKGNVNKEKIYKKESEGYCYLTIGDIKIRYQKRYFHKNKLPTKEEEQFSNLL